MEKSLGYSYFWEYLYIFIMTLIIGLLPFIFILLSSQVVLVVLLITIIGVFIVWRRSQTKILIYLNNVLLIATSLSITYILIFAFKLSTDSMIGALAGVAIMDFTSFTRAGRFTLNAKLVGNSVALSRLSIVLTIPKKSVLQPIIGVGDLTYYSFIIMFFLKAGGSIKGLIAVFILLVCQCINLVFITIMRRKNYTKGFPATLVPGLAMIATIIISNYLTK